MADKTLIRGEKLIFDSDDSSDTYLYQEDTDDNIFKQIVQNEEVLAWQVEGGANARAVIVRTKTIGSGESAVERTCWAIPLDQTGAAIQTAIDQLHGLTSGGIVRIPEGTYSVSSSIEMYENIILQGSGAETILQATGSGLAAPIIKNEDETASSAKSFWAIRDLTIDNKYYTTSGGVGIRLQRMSNGAVANVFIKNVQIGLLLKDYSYYNTISNVSTSETKTGVCLAALYGHTPNSNRFFNVRVINTNCGFEVHANDCSFFSCRVQIRSVPTSQALGFYLYNSANTKGNRVYSPQLSGPVVTGSYGIYIGPNAADNLIIAPYIVGFQYYVSDPSAPHTIYFGHTAVSGLRYLSLGYCRIQTEYSGLTTKLYDGSNWSDIHTGKLCLADQALLYGSSGQVYLRNVGDTSYGAQLNTGHIYIGGGSESFDAEVFDNTKGLILKRNDGNKRFRVTVDDSGALSLTEL